MLSGRWAVICYPRTATVSFEVGIAPLTGDSALPLFIYSVIYFAIVILVSLYPGKLLDTVGNFTAPLKIGAGCSVCRRNRLASRPDQ